jgi:hypothetical protein
VVAYRIRKHLIIDIATIEKGSGYLGMISSIKPEDLFTQWRSEYEADILVSLASLAVERMFFEGDSSSGCSGDLDTATYYASYMEGYWGMGKTVSSAAMGRALESGTPGGGGGGGGGAGGGAHATAKSPVGIGTGPSPLCRLADRIEDNLKVLLAKAEDILRENERHVLALAHALETYKTFSGEDVEAVLEGRRGPLVDGTPYADDAFIDRLREYHVAAVRAHREHGSPDMPLPVAEPAFAIADGFGSGSFSFGDNGNGNGTATEAGETIDFGGFGAGNPNGNGSHNGPLGAPTYDPPGNNRPDDSDEDDHS